jgi:hypothetical protein
MPIIDDTKLYEKVKEYADQIYQKPSAYKSGFIVKTYKELGGTYTNDNKPKNLKRWYLENWENISKPNEYPVLRPTKKISKKTPLTANEISPLNLRKQIKLKQYYQGKKNLPPFRPSGTETKGLKKIKNNNIMPQIIYITESPRLFKKYRVYLDDGTYYDFGLDKSQTYLDHHNNQIRENYRLRHLGNAKEKELIENLIPSPSLFSYYLLWNTTSLIDNIEILNSLFIKKYKSK